MGTALAIGVALIGAGAGFGGGFFGARWQARHTLAQLRRDRLLQFCADLLAAGGELLRANVVKVEDRRYPVETMQRFAHAVACVVLLGGQDLDEPAFAHQDAVLAAFGEAVDPNSDPSKQDQALKAAATCQAQFMWLAHNLLLNTPRNPRRWWEVWKREPNAAAVSETDKTTAE